MAKTVKKKKKKLGASGGSKKEISTLRPKYVAKIPPCSDTCPSSEPIRTYLTQIAQGEAYGRSIEESTEQAFYQLTTWNPIPAVMGRVCPHPCESKCNRGEFDSAVAINNVERYIGDFALQKGLKFQKPENSFDEKMAVIGAGPSGLSCAYHLAKLGYSVTLFEQFAKPGGMIRWGIPEYRLPRDVIDKEVERIQDLGVEIKYNTKIGKDVAFDDLKKDYKAIYLAIGAHVGYKLGVEGEDSPNVFDGADFLHRVSDGEKIDVGSKVLVVGGGDTAIDCARNSRRLGAEVTIVYRRSRTEMPAIAHEIDEAEREAVKLELLTAPLGFVTENGKASGMKCQRMELGEPDASGRRRPVPIEGSEFVIDATTVIAAIGQEPDFNGLDQFKNGRDWVKVDDKRMTSVDGVFGGGDAIELSLVTNAVGHGRMAAVNMHHYARGTEQEACPDIPVVTFDKLNINYYKKSDRNEITTIPVDKALSGWEEVNIGLTTEQTLEEAKRCFSCGSCWDCDNCWTFCGEGVVEKLPKGEHFSFYKMEKCLGCSKCAEECPCGYIDMA